MRNNILISLTTLSFFTSNFIFALTAKDAREQIKSGTWEGVIFSGTDYLTPVTSIRIYFTYHSIGGTSGSYYELYSKDTKQRSWLKKSFEKYVLEQEPVQEKEIEISSGKLKLAWDIIEKNNTLFVEMRFYNSLYLNPFKGDPILVLSIPFDDFDKAQKSGHYGPDNILKSSYWKEKNFIKPGRFSDEDINGFDITFMGKDK